MIITGVRIQQADVPNQNGHIYPKTVLNQVAEHSGEFLGGMLGMPTTMNEPINGLSHMARNLRAEDDFLLADIEIVDTPSGRMLGELWEKQKIDFRLAGSSNNIVTNNGSTVTIMDFIPHSVNAVINGA